MRMFVLMLGVGLVCSHAAVADGQGNAKVEKPVKAAGDKVKTDYLPTTLDLDPKIGLEPSDAEKKSFTSQPVGVRQKWQLDKGHFENDERMSGMKRPDETSEDYSGIRLRRPRKP